jgi:hypothetical protein
MPILLFGISAEVCIMLYALGGLSISTQGLPVLAAVSLAGIWCCISYRLAILQLITYSVKANYPKLALRSTNSSGWY